MVQPSPSTAAQQELPVIQLQCLIHRCLEVCHILFHRKRDAGDIALRRTAGVPVADQIVRPQSGRTGVAYPAVGTEDRPSASVQIRAEKGPVSAGD